MNDDHPRSAPKIDDDMIARQVRGEHHLTNTQIDDLLAELLRYRRVARSDSRRSDQVKRLRWQAETLTSKVEELYERAAELGRKFEGETLDSVVESDRGPMEIKEPACS